MKTFRFTELLLLLALSFVGPLFADTTHSSPPVPYLSPEEEARTFVLPEGYQMELVVADPIIKEPVVTVFDGNGRMFVAEMRSYMQEIDGKDEHVPAGRVSMHWSSKGDGVYDQHRVFIDHLVLPRMILPLADGLLVNETDSEDLWLYRDTNGDGVADKKELFFAGGPRGGNLEHQQSGLIWDRDNWIYQAANSYRLRLKGTNVVKQPTPGNGGQWGLTQDDYGKLWIVNAGGELGPVNFQVPIIYGGLKARSEPTEDFMAVWPLVGLADVQGGIPRFRPEDKTLNHFTASCGPDIYRGDRLPSDLRGDLLFGEPVGRLIRRAKISVEDGITHLKNPYDKSEFLRSSDPNFRPVNMVTAPDGTLYIVDMYRGIIQEGAWVREGSYLRKVVQQYQLDKNFGRGRIWRLKHRDFQPGPAPHMLDESAAQLVKHLEHPNGWWRDTAQKLIILRGDNSVVPALNRLAQESQNPLARIDALWTLEGLEALNPALVREKLKDQDSQVRIAAIRVSESIYLQGDRSLVADVSALIKDHDPSVALQVGMTAKLLKWTETENLMNALILAHPTPGVRELGLQLLQPPRANVQGLTSDERKIFQRGEVIYQELCFACHGLSGKGMPVQGSLTGETMAPPLSGATSVTGLRDEMINIVLKGLRGPVDGKNYAAQMVAMDSNDDTWVAAVTSYVRNSFGNSASMVEAADVARIRASLKHRSEPWSLEELHAVLPQPLTNHAQWKATASHHPETAPLGIDGDPHTGYRSAVAQQPGMWFEVELPQETTLTGCVLDAASSAKEFPRGYKVEVSKDGQNWGDPVATGHGTSAVTEAVFPPTFCKFIRITETSAVKGSIAWSIHELSLFKPGATPKNGAGAADKPKASQFE